MEEWRQVGDFPGYSISSAGRVRNDDTGRIMALSRNQAGVIHVGLTKSLRQYKRSVAVLVACYFLDPPRLNFDTPIHLDGDRDNCEADNLMWRPRWFAIKYHQQFENNRRGYHSPIREISTGEEFETSWQAAVKYGLLDRDILLATENKTFTWPTYQIFEHIGY